MTVRLRKWLASHFSRTARAKRHFAKANREIDRALKLHKGL